MASYVPRMTQPDAMKPHWQMNKSECLQELAQISNAVGVAQLTLPEVRILVKEERIRQGLVKTPGPVDNFMDNVKRAKQVELQEMCHSRGIPVIATGKNKTTVGEMRLAFGPG